MDGRRAAAEGAALTRAELAALAQRGWDVLDGARAVGAAGGVDHVLVGPRGVFSLASRRSAERLQIVAGGGAFRTPRGTGVAVRGDAALAAAWASAGRLREHVLERTGVLVRVAPVLVWWGPFPDRGRAHRGVLVVRGEELVALLEAQPPRPVPARAAVLAALEAAPVPRIAVPPVPVPPVPVPPATAAGTAASPVPASAG